MAFDNDHFEIIKLEVARHLEDTETSKLAHWHAAAVYDRRHKLFIGLPATLISLILTWMLSSGTQRLLNDTGSLKILFDNTPIILSLLVTILSGLGTFLNFNELAIKHRTAAENLHALWRDCKNWNTDYPDISLCEKAMQTVQIYRNRLNEINRDSPQIPKWAWKNVKQQQQEGSTQYSLEKTN